MRKYCELAGWTTKLILYLIAITLLAAISHAYPGTYTTFIGTGENGSWLWGGSETITEYLDLAVGSTVTDASIRISGQNISSALNYGFESDDDNLELQNVTGVITRTPCAPNCISGSTIWTRHTASASVEYGRVILPENYTDTVNISMYLRTTGGGNSGVTIANTSTAHTGGGIRLGWAAGGVNCWKRFPSYICVDSDLAGFWTFEINLTNSTYGLYRNDVYVATEPLTGITNIDTIDLSGGTGGTSCYLDNITIDGGLLAYYPHNLTIYANNQLVYAYGATNNSAFIQQDYLINFTTALASITSTPVPFTIFSNMTGGINWDNLFIRDTFRNFTFEFFDEQDRLVFDLNSTNTTLTIQCPTSRYEYPVTSGTYVVGVECENFEYLSVEVEDDGSEWYRTLLVPPGAGATPNIDWYMVNLNNKSVVQNIINLEDRTGYKWAGSTATITRTVNSTASATIIEQTFDVDNRVYLYLMQYAEYMITIENSYGEVWSGSFIADQAEEKTIELPGIGFLPDDQYLEEDIRYSWEFDAPTGRMNFTFQDLGGHTSFVNFTILNASTGGLIGYGESVGPFVNGIKFYYPVSPPSLLRGNESYIGVAWYYHSVLGWHEIRQVFGDYSGGVDLEGFTGVQSTRIFKWFSFIILIVLALSFGPKHAHIGLLFTFGAMVLFKRFGWLTWTSTAVLIVIGLISVYNWFRVEEVRAG